MLFKARLRWREKLELLILFSGGLFVMMAGILRCVLILTVSWLSMTQSARPDVYLGWCQWCPTSWQLGVS
jgi:hypothetical protein